MKKKEDAFYTNLEFGTAGMRGYIGAGTNRINVFVVRQATEGLAKLVESKGEEAKNVVLPSLTTHVTSRQNLLLNQLKFWQRMVSNLMYLKAFVQLLSCHSLCAITMPSQVSW